MKSRTRYRHVWPLSLISDKPQGVARILERDPEGSGAVLLEVECPLCGRKHFVFQYFAPKVGEWITRFAPCAKDRTYAAQVVA